MINKFYNIIPFFLVWVAGFFTISNLTKYFNLNLDLPLQYLSANLPVIWTKQIVICLYLVRKPSISRCFIPTISCFTICIVRSFCNIEDVISYLPLCLAVWVSIPNSSHVCLGHNPMKIDNLLISVKSPPIGTVYTVPTGGTVREAIIHSIPVEDIRTIVIAPPVTAGVTVGQNHTYDYRYRNTSRMRNFYVNDSLLPTQCPQIDLNIPFIQHQGPSGRSN